MDLRQARGLCQQIHDQSCMPALNSIMHTMAKTREMMTQISALHAFVGGTNFEQNTQEALNLAYGLVAKLEEAQVMLSRAAERVDDLRDQLS